MGMENDVMLTYLGNNERFADTFNFGCFAGEHVVQADELTDVSEISRPSIREIYDAAKQQIDQKQKPATRTRDLTKKLRTGQSVKIVAIESQSDINYLMPWRIMNYDDKDYEKQVNQIVKRNKRYDEAGLKVYRSDAERLSQFRTDDRLNPVYTLCVYHGTKPWEGPRTLKDMMDFGTENPELWEHLFADYPMRLICLNEIHDFSGLRSSVKELFSLLPHRKSKQEMLNYVDSHPEYHTLDDETIEAISCMTNIPNLIEKKDDYKTEGGYDMCQAIKELIEDSKAEGRTEGFALNAKIFKFIQANNNIDSESIAAACECTLDDVIEFRTAFGI